MSARRASLAALALAVATSGLACQSRVGLTKHADGGHSGQTTDGGSYAGAGGAPVDGGPEAPADDGRLAANFDPGALHMRRLSAVEYTRTLQDLLGLAQVDATRARAFAEDVFYDNGRFDNLADGPPVNELQAQELFENAVTLVQQTFAEDALRARIVTCAPAGAAWQACAHDIVKAFGLRAWRRPLTDAELADLVALVGADVAAGSSFVDAIQQPLIALLLSESFLYRLELDPADVRVHPLTSYELASRLSYLFWSTMPDDTLFALAATDELQQSDTLAAQVTRLLADPRSDGLVRNFFGQWLGFRRLDGLPLTREQPGWSAGLQASAAGEARLFISELVHGDGDVSDLLTADVNFVDLNLSMLYRLRIPGTAPPDQLARTVSTTDARKGYLGLAAFLALESEPNEQSRFPRGARVSAALLCSPVPPPPPALPPTPPSTTPRQQYEQLLAMPACGACHKLFEPLGLAFESFNDIGQFRTTYASGAPVDARGELLDGTAFEGLAGLADLLAKDPRVRDCIRRQALVYALGRPLTDTDTTRFAAIDTRWNAAHGTVRGLLGAIVADGLFQYRRGEARQ